MAKRCAIGDSPRGVLRHAIDGAADASPCRHGSQNCLRAEAIEAVRIPQSTAECITGYGVATSITAANSVARSIIGDGLLRSTMHGESRTDFVVVPQGEIFVH